MRGWTIGWWLGLALGVMVAGNAIACMNCTQYNTCAGSHMGASMCLAGDWSCFQAGRCVGPIAVEDYALIGVTLLEDAAGSSRMPSRVVPTIGESAVGRSAVRIADAAGGTILYSGTGYFAGGTAVFRAPSGDGFTLRLDREGDGARVSVHALAAGRPGRVLAHERLDGSGALVVRVPFGGRTRVLVFTAAAGTEDQKRDRDAAARRELKELPAPADMRPPFELQVLDR